MACTIQYYVTDDNEGVWLNFYEFTLMSRIEHNYDFY